jgi:hypothetical protein
MFWRNILLHLQGWNKDVMKKNQARGSKQSENRG